MSALSAASVARELEASLVGRVINDRFKVLSLIGQGGMGAVFRAQQLQLDRVVALKVLKQDPALMKADPNFVRRFNLEASLCSKISHPNVVTIFDYGQVEFDDQLFYIAMEFLDGVTLHQKLKRAGGALPLGEALSIAVGVARGLREAHRQGVIHRDLKPGNIILISDEDGGERPKIVDFGLVKQMSDSASEELTVQGTFLGSPKYMSPEQVAGTAVDHRADVYSLGVILYQCLCGRVPFDEGTPMQVLVAHASKPVPPLRERNPTCVVPEAVEQLVYRMLEKNVDARTESMDAFLREVRALREVIGPELATGSFVAGMTGTFEIAIAGATTSGPTGSGAVQRASEPPPPSETPKPVELEPSVSHVAASPRPHGAPSRNVSPVVIALAVVGGLALVGGVALGLRRDRPAREAPVSHAPAREANAPSVTAASDAPRRAAPEVREAAPSNIASEREREAETTASDAASGRRSSIATRTSTVRSGSSANSNASAHRASSSTAAAASNAADHAGASATSAPVAEAPGYLSLDTTPYSVVSEGGRTIGTTPLLRVPLAPGAHTLTLRNPEQGLSTTYQITIRSGETVSRRLGLE